MEYYNVRETNELAITAFQSPRGFTIRSTISNVDYYTVSDVKTTV